MGLNDNAAVWQKTRWGSRGVNLVFINDLVRNIRYTISRPFCKPSLPLGLRAGTCLFWECKACLAGIHKPLETMRKINRRAKTAAPSLPPPKKFSTRQIVGLVAVSLGWMAWGGLRWHQVELPALAEPALIFGLGAGIFVLMLGCVLSVVRNADRLADLLPEPYGTLVLTLSSTIIEVSLLLQVMLNGKENPSLLRDTVFAILMLSMNGMVGMSITGGGWRHREQEFNLRGALSFVQLIAPLSLMLLIMPKYTLSTDGPSLDLHQEIYLGSLCAVVYLLFLMLQTGRHRSYFDHLDAAVEATENKPHTPTAGGRNRLTVPKHVAGLIMSLVPVVLLAEYMGEAINYGIDELKAPTALGGLIIASLGLTSEGIGAIRAALANRMQRAVNICLGAALSTIGLTVPTILIAASFLGMELSLGLEGTNATLLMATLLITMLTFVSGGANILQGIVHLMLFLGYVIFILFP
jgi:Ca2+:H+ antiporter